MKTNYYTIEKDGPSMALMAYLDPEKSKFFDYGLGYEKNDVIIWKGSYSKTSNGWLGIVERSNELHNLGIFREYIEKTTTIDFDYQAIFDKIDIDNFTKRMRKRTQLKMKSIAKDLIKRREK